MNDKLKEKLRLALRDEILTPQELKQVLTFRTKSQLIKLMNALNEMYSDDEIMPVYIGEEKHLMLVRK